MDDTIYRQAAYDTLTEYYHHRTDAQHDALRDALNRVPSAQQKKLKYFGESICVRCQTKDCDGCLFEPMKGVMNDPDK